MKGKEPTRTHQSEKLCRTRLMIESKSNMMVLGTQNVRRFQSSIQNRAVLIRPATASQLLDIGLIIRLLGSRTLTSWLKLKDLNEFGGAASLSPSSTFQGLDWSFRFPEI